jgi:curved DNA-binding protein CbpA
MAPQVSTTSFTTYYDVLHLPRDSTKAQIKSRYRKLSLLFHPDKNKEDYATAVFRSLKTAEEILTDIDKRAIFDGQLTEIDRFIKGGSASGSRKRCRKQGKRSTTLGA